MSIDYSIQTNTLNVRCIKDSHNGYRAHKSCPYYEDRPDTIVQQFPPDRDDWTPPKQANRLNPLCKHFHLISYEELYGFCELSKTRESMDIYPLHQFLSAPRRLEAPVTPEEANYRASMKQDVIDRNGEMGNKPRPL